MTIYSKEQRAKIVECYFKHNESLIRVQREFTRLSNQQSPSRHCIIAMVSKFRETGSTTDRKRIGGPRSIRNETTIQRVAASVTEDNQTSTRKRAMQLGLSRSSLQRILKKDLKMFPYKVQVAQHLQFQDYQKRKEFAFTFLRLTNDEAFLSHLIMSDEAHFHLGGYVNKQNYRFWGVENPKIIHTQLSHPQKVTVWCGITNARILGPYFFEDGNGAAVTVNGENYRKMIEEYLLPKMEDLNMQNFWFQQDGATAHTARDTMALLRAAFPERLISRFGDVPWPPRSPDLTSPDFFLWGYLKGKVYRNRPNTLQELKNNIIEEINTINAFVLGSVSQNIVQRMRICYNNDGKHLKDVIFKH